MIKKYCTQNNGMCDSCSLVNYGLDCNNVKIEADILEQSCGNDVEFESLLRSAHESLIIASLRSTKISTNTAKYSRQIAATQKLSDIKDNASRPELALANYDVEFGGIEQTEDSDIVLARLITRSVVGLEMLRTHKAYILSNITKYHSYISALQALSSIRIYMGYC